MSDNKDISRRDFIKAAGAGLFLADLHCALPLPAWALTTNSGITNDDIQAQRNNYLCKM